MAIQSRRYALMLVLALTAGHSIGAVLVAVIVDALSR